MPAATTHVISAMEILQRLPEKNKKEIDNQAMYYLGSQGPDLFFFHNFGNSKTLKPIGNYMHEYKIFAVINYMYEYIFNKKHPRLKSYFYGYLCHYALDSMVHPIVYNRSLFNDFKEEELVTHFKIEAFYDRYTLEKRNLKFTTDKMLKVNKEDALSIADMYNQLIKDLFNKDISAEEIKKTCLQVSQILNLLKPNSRLKYNLIKAYETLTCKPRLISSLMLYTDFDDHDYILNNNHMPFENISDNSIIYTNTFDELYESGILKAIELIKNPLNKDYYQLDFNGDKIKKSA